MTSEPRTERRTPEPTNLDPKVSENQHRVAVAVEAITLPDGGAISVEDELTTGEGADEHEER
jgi:hypothetical protein